MAFAARIVADSLSPDFHRLTTFEVTFPRFILAEVNTHRMLSRNSASSRAIPLEKQIKKLQLDPFTPEAWPTEQKGMSGGAPLTSTKEVYARDAWLTAREQAIKSAQAMAKQGVHKSLCNRLLEPFMWHTAIISGTEWGNFFALRTDKNAQPEFRKIALWMQDLYHSEKPRDMSLSGWHLPLVHDEEKPAYYGEWEYWKKVSVGRCARVSYLTHDGERDPDKDVELHDRLLASGHLSPFEHVATPWHDIPSANFRGWRQYRFYIPNEDDFSKVIRDESVAV